jgi:hypothetical protein
MDRKLETLTNTNHIDLPKNIFLVETQGNIKPSISNKNKLLIGAWTCALLLTSAQATGGIYEMTTALNYQNKNTQTTISYEPSYSLDSIDEEVNSNIFVATQPINSYPVKLKISRTARGEPVV